MTWSLGREGQATTENDTSGPILRPLFPGLSGTGCQPLITHLAPEALVVPATCTVFYYIRPEPRERGSQSSRDHSLALKPMLQTCLCAGDTHTQGERETEEQQRKG